MSGLTFRLSAAPDERLDLSQLTPETLSAIPVADVPRLIIGTSKRGLTVGDVFKVSGTPGDSVVIEGGSRLFDYVGAKLKQGTIIVEGEAGMSAGRLMRGGSLEIRGDAGAWLASCLAGGIVTVKGSAGSYVGGQQAQAGDKFGMTGGIVVIEGDVGDRAGERMRRGTIVVRGSCGANAGSRMIGGTIWAERGFGAAPGLLMRRGTLIGAAVESMLPTFADSGMHDLVVLRILSRYLSTTLGPLAPRAITGGVHKYAGDLATIGKGEILITA